MLGQRFRHETWQAQKAHGGHIQRSTVSQKKQRTRKRKSTRTKKN